MKLLLVTLAAAALCASACSRSSSSSSSSSGGSGGSAEGNPVDIAKMVPGCTLPPGSEVGDRDINGNRYVSCEIAPTDDPESTATEDVTVRMYSSNADRDRDLQTNGGSDDDNKVLIGDRFMIIVTGVMNLDTGGTDYYISPESIAEATKTKLV